MIASYHSPGGIVYLSSHAEWLRTHYHAPGCLVSG